MNIENQEIPKKSFKEFVKENKVIIISFLTLLVLGLLVFIGFNEYTKKKNLLVSENFNKAKILIDRNNNEEALKILEKIVYKNNKFYSPLSLNIILEKKLIKDKNKIISYFDEIISNLSVDLETKNLFIFKKTIFLGGDIEENELLKNLKPIIQSNSVWKNAVSNYIQKYYLSKKEYNKAKEFKSNN